MHLTPTAERILKERYLLRKGKVWDEGDETPREMCARIAKCIASAETHEELQQEWETRFTALLMNQYFLPNTPTIMNAGNEGGMRGNYTLSACFVLPIYDSIQDIMDTAKMAALIYKSGGGTGFNFSFTRPRGSLVNTTKGQASGPVSWMQIIDAVAESVKGGGKRRAANMAMLDISHPDILEFIHAKEDNTSISNFNLSVLVPDAFMAAVQEDTEWYLWDKNAWNDEKLRDHYLKPTAEASAIPARDLWNEICYMAHRTGDPGIAFFDHINADYPLLKTFGPLISSNPCGEQFLEPFNSCNLGSINLGHSDLVTEAFGENPTFNYPLFETIITESVRFLDNVIDKNAYVDERLHQMNEQTRRIGLGLMGYADLLVKMKLTYGSPEALEFTMHLASYFQKCAEDASKQLATIKGEFPLFSSCKFKKKTPPRRNLAITTIAPTGTISTLANCYFGIEPYFSIEAIKRNILDTELEEIPPAIREYQSLFPGEPLPHYFVDTHDISVEQHIDTQSTFQRYIDNSISKTVNVPEETTKEEIGDIFMQAWNKQCKDITVFRDGCKLMQVLDRKGRRLKSIVTYLMEEVKRHDVQDIDHEIFEQLEKIIGILGLTPGYPKRPEVIDAKIHRIDADVSGGQLDRFYISVSLLNKHPFELFINSEVEDFKDQQLINVLARLTSMALRGGIPIPKIIEQLMRIKGQYIHSLPSKLAGILAQYSGTNGNSVPVIKGKCRNCGNEEFYLIKRCKTCTKCGESSCG